MLYLGILIGLIIGTLAKPNTTTNIKYADLCPRCMRALDRGIKKGKKNE